jgi:hypothetical protein
MKKLNDNMALEVKGSGNLYDALSGFMAGWAIGAIFVGAATRGFTVANRAAVVSQYCFSK